MTKLIGHGGKRAGAGRKKKTETEKEAIRFWYGLVCEGTEYPRSHNVSGLWESVRQDIHDRWPNRTERKNIFGKEDVWIGVKTAWYSYEKGDKYPDRGICQNIDRYIVARNCQSDNEKKNLIRHPVRWVLAQPGKLNLSPVWGWSPFNCEGVPPEEIPFAAKVHAKFHERISPDKVFSLLQETVLSVQGDPSEYKWPPILLLPTVLAKSRATVHPDLPHPYLMEEPLAEDCPLLDYEENYRKFAEWSLSTGAKASSGIFWFHKAPNYLKLLYDLGNVKFISSFSGGVLNSSVSLEEILEYAESISPAFADQCLSRVLGIP